MVVEWTVSVVVFGDGYSGEGRRAVGGGQEGAGGRPSTSRVERTAKKQVIATVLCVFT